MTDGKPYSWSAKPESLEAKFKLMCRLPHDSRVKRRHMLVFGFILDWYHSGYGNALASVRHIDAHLKARDPAGVGLYTGQIHGPSLTLWLGATSIGLRTVVDEPSGTSRHGVYWNFAFGKT